MTLFSVSLNQHCWQDISVNFPIKQIVGENMWLMSCGDCIIDLCDQFLNILSLSNGLFWALLKWGCSWKESNSVISGGQAFLHAPFDISAECQG